MTKLLKVDELASLFPEEEQLLPEVKLDAVAEVPVVGEATS